MQGQNKIIFRHARFQNITLKLSQKSNTIDTLYKGANQERLCRIQGTRACWEREQESQGDGEKKCQAHSSAAGSAVTVLARGLRRPWDKEPKVSEIYTQESEFENNYIEM